MELSPGQQKAIFAVVVVVLVGLGIWLIASPHGSKPPSASKSPSMSLALFGSPPPTRPLGPVVKLSGSMKAFLP